MRLFFRKYGKGGTPLIIVHGLYGSGDNWVSIARDLSKDFEVYVIDQRNHGRSPHSSVHDYAAMRDDLKKLMDAEGIEQAVLMGHSMGGKTVMLFALEWPDRVLALISVDIAPKSYHELALQSHSTADHGKMIDAMLELELAGLESREEIDRALAPKIGSDRIRSFLLKNIRRDSKGGFSWRINLPALRDNLPKILDGPGSNVVAGGHGAKIPALFIAGERSDYIQAGDMSLIRGYFPLAQLVTIPGAGHWLHAEKPALLLKNVQYFLDGIDT